MVSHCLRPKEGRLRHASAKSKSKSSASFPSPGRAHFFSPQPVYAAGMLVASRGLPPDWPTLWDRETLPTLALWTGHLSSMCVTHSTGPHDGLASPGCEPPSRRLGGRRPFPGRRFQLRGLGWCLPVRIGPLAWVMSVTQPVCIASSCPRALATIATCQPSLIRSSKFI